MALPSAYIYCPHIIETTKQPCGLSDTGRGRVTRIPIPFGHLDGQAFVISCPQCDNEIMVDPAIAADDDEEEAA